MADDPRDQSPGGPPPASPDASTTPMSPAQGRDLARPKRAALGIGELLANRYKVVRFIGEGGMGEVYEAEDCELHERVALKTILPEIARQADSVQRFKREIQLARKVTHPNVCRIFDLVYHGTTIFLTMELLEGETLLQRLRRTGAMTTGEAFPLVAQMAAGLAAAHLAGIVHRDFKSGNVMLVRAQGQEAGVRPVIMDFGLARRSATGGGPTGLTTATEAIAGTPAYMAPEQVEGGDVTPAADIYALGVVLYEMVTGRCPFEGDTPLSVAVKRLQEPAPSPRSHNPSLDPRWEKAILCCLERNPMDRFASAEEIIKALESHAPPVEPSEQPRMLEAAAPKRAAVGRSMQLLAMIRRVESEGLKSYLDIEEITSLTKDDVRAKPFRLEFPLDRKGTPQPAEIILRLDSPDFEPKSQAKKLMVPPERDSEVCTFLLIPKVGGELLLNLEVLKGEVLVASRSIRTVAEITEQQLALGPNVLVSIPLEVIAYGLRAAMGSAGEFTTIFQSPPKSAVPPPLTPVPPPPVVAPSSSVPKPSGPGEFTRMFESSREPSAPPIQGTPSMPRPAAAPPMPSAPVPPKAPPPAAAAPLRPAPRAVPLPAPPRPADFTRVMAPPPPRAMAPPPRPPLAQSDPPVVTAPLPLPKPSASRWGLWAALMVVLVGLGGGFYNVLRPHAPGSEPIQAPPSTVNPSGPPSPTATLAPPPEPAPPPMAPRPEAPSMPAPVPRPAAPAVAVPPPAALGIKRHINMADFHRARGEYDEAIADYEEILKLDPSNSYVRQKLEETIRTCKEENAVLGESLKCGTPEAPAPGPNPALPPPLIPATAARNPVVTLLPSGPYQALTRPVANSQIVPDNSVDGGLKPINLAMPSIAGAPPDAFVLFMINIDPNGNVTPVGYFSDNNGLRPRVTAAAKKWKFKPPTAQGKPVSTSVAVKVTF